MLIPLILIGLTLGVVVAEAQVPEFDTDAHFQTYEQQKFPALPQSRPCALEDIYGIWKQAKVYEFPAGPESSAFAAQPFQYSMYLSDNTYGHYSGYRNLPSKTLFRSLLSQKEGAKQYVFDRSSPPIIYTYQNSVAVDSMACFIVIASNGTFSGGQMLLMPPENQSTTRLVKSFQKVWTPPPGWVKPN